jgi:flagellin-like hook-associated protein FlgL
MSSITLTATERQTILSLQQVTSLQNTTQERLNTGKKVNSATDNAVAYFRSQALYDRSTAFNNYNQNIDQSIQSLNAALTATSSVETLLQQLQGVLENARGASTSQRTSATVQFTNIADQLAQLVKDSTYQGLNILTSSSATLTTQFSDRTAATFTVSGYNLINSTKGNSRSIFTQSAAVFKSSGNLVFSSLVHNAANSKSVKGFSSLNLSASTGSTVPGSIAEQIFNATDTAIQNAINQVQAITAALGTNVNILTARSQFSVNYANVLTSGGDALTLADLNSEAADSEALNLRQQLGIQSLTNSTTQNQSILTLLRA